MNRSWVSSSDSCHFLTEGQSFLWFPGKSRLPACHVALLPARLGGHHAKWDAFLHAFAVAALSGLVPLDGGQNEQQARQEHRGHLLGIAGHLFLIFVSWLGTRAIEVLEALSLPVWSRCNKGRDPQNDGYI